MSVAVATGAEDVVVGLGQMAGAKSSTPALPKQVQNWAVQKAWFAFGEVLQALFCAVQEPYVGLVKVPVAMGAEFVVVDAEEEEEEDEKPQIAGA